MAAWTRAARESQARCVPRGKLGRRDALRERFGDSSACIPIQARACTRVSTPTFGLRSVPLRPSSLVVAETPVGVARSRPSSARRCQDHDAVIATTPVDSYRYISNFQRWCVHPFATPTSKLSADLVISVMQSNTAELAATYAALILADEGVEITVRRVGRRMSGR